MNDSQSHEVAFLDRVIGHAAQIAIVAKKGRTEEAVAMAVSLVELVNNRKHQIVMQQEQTAGCDLKNLSIDIADSRRE